MIKLNIQRFASTNKTANYNLSQYIDNDKPSYLGDYNSDMEKIDSAMHTNATTISGVDAKAETAKTTADTALGNASDADTKATNAQSTATSALEKATSNEVAINQINKTATSLLQNAGLTGGQQEYQLSASYKNYRELMLVFKRDTTQANVFPVYVKTALLDLLSTTDIIRLNVDSAGTSFDMQKISETQFNFWGSTQLSDIWKYVDVYGIN